MCPSLNMSVHVLLLFLSGLLLVQPTPVISTTTNITAAVDAITDSSFNQTLPGCKPTCGNLTVPYPFGIGSGCSISSWFEINCSTFSGPPKPFLGDGNLEVISISETQVRVRNFVTTRCYNESGNTTVYNLSSTQLGSYNTSPFAFSAAANKFTVVGCDDLGIISGSSQTQNVTSGCVSTCYDGSELLAIDGNCTGIGCCQTDIPKGLKVSGGSLTSFNDHSEVLSFNPCSYAFLGEQGYLCRCNSGHKGNPYLSPGCSDIDECEDSNLNNCDVNANCINTPGSFHCSCHDHYFGDGTKDGKGCTPKASQLFVIKVSLGT
ncbi:hypothetical protein Vadar_001427 [Vaccinium darrowii]|uniref:Uncharacterized protein n=1 Tax=Vaccinium darrowii TaxID=229202 RepID=A0ACB7XME4_9ERIC|nr:hypothetical protein Vadar_001427 [Vaccinium darrowii]